MTSYKTLIFGTIAFVCAASPALADVPSAVPGPTRHDVPSAVPGPARKDVPSAVPGPARHDVPSAVPKFIVIAGIAGLPAMRLDLAWLQRFIDR